MQILKTKMDRKGALQLGEVPNAVIVVGTLIITLAIIALVIAGVQDNTGATRFALNATSGEPLGNETLTSSFNITVSGLTGLQNMGNFLPVVGLVVIAAVIIGLLVFFRREV